MACRGSRPSPPFGRVTGERRGLPDAMAPGATQGAPGAGVPGPLASPFRPRMPRPRPASSPTWPWRSRASPTRAEPSCHAQVPADRRWLVPAAASRLGVGGVRIVRQHAPDARTHGPAGDLCPAGLSTRAEARLVGQFDNSPRLDPARRGCSACHERRLSAAFSERVSEGLEGKPRDDRPPAHG
jgi:hypothetical protein